MRGDCEAAVDGFAGDIDPVGALAEAGEVDAGRELKGAAKSGDGLVEFAEIEQRMTEIVVSLDKIRLEGERSAEGLCRLRDTAEVAPHGAEVVVHSGLLGARASAFHNASTASS